MSRPLLLCVLPAERAHLCAVVLAAGAVPVIDLTAADAADLPAGAWARALPGRPVPGQGPVILAEEGQPIRGRPTWLERASPGPAPEGFAGVLLRGVEAPGRGGERPGLDMLAEMPAGTPTILEAGLSPVEAARAVAAGARGVVLSDVLLALPELALPPRLCALLAEVGPLGGRRVAGTRVLCPTGAPALRRLAEGASPWEICRGWFSGDDPAQHPWPAGAGLAIARGLAARHGGLQGLIAAYEAAIQAGAQERLEPVVDAVLPSLRALVSAIAEQLAPAAPAHGPVAAPGRPAVICAGLGVGLPGGGAFFGDDNLEALTRGEPRLPRAPRGEEDARGPRLLRAGALSLAEDYGLHDAPGLDAADAMALAAGLEALADAGVPLVLDPALPGGRGLPAALRARTAVIAARALPRRAPRAGTEDAATSLARALGAAGPALSLGAGRASATVALGLAADWIALGRAERALVVCADDPTDPAWPLSEAEPAEALGAGAAGFLLEREDLAAARGRAGRARIARVEAEETGLLSSGVLVETPQGRNMVSCIPYFGDALGAGLDDALAVEAVARGLGGQPVSRALRVALDGAGAPALLAWEPAAPADAARAEAWLIATTELPLPLLGRQGRVLVASREPLPPPQVPAPAPAPEPEPPAPEAPEPEPEPAPTVTEPQPAPTAPAPTARPAPLPAPEDDEQVLSRGGSSRLAAWSRRLRRKNRRSQADLARSGDWLGLARERVLSDLLLQIASQDEEATAPPTDSRLGADLGIDLEEQGELLGRLCAGYGVALDTDDLLADDPPLEGLVARIVDEARAVWRESPEVPAGLRRLFALEPTAPAEPEGTPAAAPPIVVRPAPAAVPTPLAQTPDAAPAALVTGLVAAEAGYRPEELRPELELEGDLGLDGAARARIVGALCARFGVPAPELEEPLTLAALIRWVAPLAPLAQAPPRAAPPRAPVLIEEPAPRPPAPREPSPAPVAREPLPPAFRVRRLVRVLQPLSAIGSVRGRVVQVFGVGALAEALRRELLVRGAKLEGTPDAVLDLGDDPAQSHEAATSLAATPPRDWICFTQLGEGGAEPWVALRSSGRAGLARALRREWPGCRARAVDLDPTLEEAEAVLIALEELSAGDDALEVWRSPGARRVGALRTEESPPPAAWPGARPTVLVAGGTRGVGFRVALALARRTRARLILLARNAPAKRPYDESTARAAVERALRARGRRVSETRILRGLEPYRLAEEARQSVARLEAAGAEVHFLRADLADPAAVAAALAELRARHDPLDGVVIALPAGELHALGGRDPAAFQAIFAPRAVGAATLAAARPPEAWLLSVGGLAGRFGQAGRVEVSAATAAMAGLCAASPRALHVTCPSWLDGGRPDEAPGADALPVEAGVDTLLDLVASGATGERVLSGRLGLGVLCACHPLVEAMDLDGDRVEITHRLRPDAEPWLADCSLGGTPILPASVAAELLVAAAHAASPGLPYAGLAALRLDEPLAVPFGGEARLVVQAEPAGPGRVRATLWAERPDQRTRARHAEATVLLAEAPPATVLPPAFFPEEAIPRSQIYRRLFHGSTFQVLGDAGAVAREGLLADAVAEHGGLGADLLSAPLVLEAAVQAATLHHMVLRGERALPARVDGVWLLRDPPDGEPLELMVQRVDEAYDVDVHGPDGAVLRVRGLRLAPLGPLSEAERFPEPEGGWPSAVVGLASS